MHNRSSVLENDIYKLLWVIDIQKDHLISARRLRLIIINLKKSICKIVDFTVQAYHRIKFKKYEKKHKYLDLARELKKTMKHEHDDYTNCDRCFWYSNYRIIKGTGGFVGKRMSGDHPNYSLIENGQNTEKCPEDLRRLAVTQTSEINDHLTLK